MDVHIFSLRSRRQNRAWGGAQRNFCAKWMFTSSACGAGGRIEPGVERSGTPGIWRNHTSSPRSGRQLFVIRHFMIIEIGPIAAARFAGWDDKSLSYLGFRCAPPQALFCRPRSRAGMINPFLTWGSAALHPRLYSAARVRGLGCNTRALCKSLGNEKPNRSRRRFATIEPDGL